MNPVLVLLAAMMAGCRSVRPVPQGVVLPDAQPPVRVEVEPAGVVVEGRFEDAAGGFSVGVPEGWRARPGPGPGLLRVSLTDPATGVRVEAWRLSSETSTLQPRNGCHWTFADAGTYRDLPVFDAVRVGTCMPDDPMAPRIQAWLLQRGGFAWQLELHLPQVGMVAARRAGLAALGTARWDR
ncbi:MAG: hypothetical protein VX265_10900 [Myxococcota bacterium]|nr:hypothetical protein [Myxococcota bacterium]